MTRPSFGLGFEVFCFHSEAFGGCLDLCPLLPQRFQDCDDNKPLDVGARSVVGPQASALLVIQCLLKQRSEDRRLNLFPVALGGSKQFANFLHFERKNLRVFE